MPEVFGRFLGWLWEGFWEGFERAFGRANLPMSRFFHSISTAWREPRPPEINDIGRRKPLSKFAIAGEIVLLPLLLGEGRGEGSRSFVLTSPNHPSAARVSYTDCAGPLCLFRESRVHTERRPMRKLAGRQSRRLHPQPPHPRASPARPRTK